MTKTEAQTLMNALLASGQPITAGGQHRPWEQTLIDELYNASSRGAVFSGLMEVLSLMTADKVFIIRAGQAYLADKSLLTIGGGAGVTDGDKGDVIVSSGGTVWTVKKDYVNSIVSTAPSTINLAFLSKERGYFSGSAPFAGPKSVVLATEANATEGRFMFEVTNLAANVTFPTNFRSDDPRFNLNVFTPLDIGLHKAVLTRYGSLWLIDFSGVYSVGDAPPVPPDPGVWILTTGIWNDDEYWQDTAIWKDTP